MKTRGMVHEKLSGEIIGAAMAVLNEPGPGLDEKRYERALVIELRKRGHKVDQQKSFAVHYSGELVGNLVPDATVDDLVIAVTNLKLALLLNFKRAKLDWKRIVREIHE